MARHAKPIEDSAGMEIYNLLVAYCGEAKVIPNPHAFWENVLVGQNKYPISRGGFTHWWLRLQIPARPGDLPLIEQDPITRAYRIRDIDVLER